MSGTCEKAIGAILGVAITGYFLVYLPMAANHIQCGRITLCPKQPEEDPDFWRRAMCTQPKYQHLRVCHTPKEPTP